MSVRNQYVKFLDANGNKICFLSGLDHVPDVGDMVVYDGKKFVVNSRTYNFVTSAEKMDGYKAFDDLSIYVYLDNVYD